MKKLSEVTLEELMEGLEASHDGKVKSRGKSKVPDVDVSAMIEEKKHKKQMKFNRRESRRAFNAFEVKGWRITSALKGGRE